MSLLDNISNRQVDVRRIIKEDSDLYVVHALNITLESLLKMKREYRIWLSFIPKYADDMIKEVEHMNYVRENLLDLPNIERWSQIYVVGSEYNIVRYRTTFAFTPDVRTAYSALRLWISLLRILKYKKCAPTGTVYFYHMGVLGLPFQKYNEMYQSLYTINFIPESRNGITDFKFRTLKGMLEVLCRREISDTEFDNAVERMMRRIKATKYYNGYS